jgi:hypothetical protein
LLKVIKVAVAVAVKDTLLEVVAVANSKAAVADKDTLLEVVAVTRDLSFLE